MAEAQADTGEKENTFAQCICRWKKKSVQVTLTDTKLQLIDKVNQSECSEIRVADILSTKINGPATKGTKKTSLSITCVIQNKNLELKQTLVTLESEDQENLKHVSDKLKELVSKVVHRPKKLLVLINPIGGRSRGPHVYETVVGPVFRSAGIETDVIVTERAHHTEEILAVYDLASISGIVLVGGDGLYNEAVNGLLMRKMTELGRNVHDPAQDVPEIDLPIGLIPCGTGNGIALACYTNYDVMTAALSVVLGYTMKFNVLPVHCDGKLLSYSAFQIGYGLWGDLIQATESRRHLGIWRYPLLIAKEILFKSPRESSLTINWKGKTTENNTESSVEQITKEHTLSVATFFFEHYNKDIKFAATAPSNEFTSMVVNKPVGKWKFLSFFAALASMDLEKLRQREDLLVLDGTEFKVTLDEPSAKGTKLSFLEHIINIDGEVKKLSSPSYRYRLCSNKLNLYCNLPFATGRQIEDKKLRLG